VQVVSFTHLGTLLVMPTSDCQGQSSPILCKWEPLGLWLSLPSKFSQADQSEAGACSMQCRHSLVGQALCFICVVVELLPLLLHVYKHQEFSKNCFLPCIVPDGMLHTVASFEMTAPLQLGLLVMHAQICLRAWQYPVTDTPHLTSWNENTSSERKLLRDRIA